MTEVLKPGSGRDSIMKMLLSSGPVVPTTSTVGSGLPSPTSDAYDDNPNRLTTYLHQLAGCFEIEVDVIVKDHCYARPWNWKPENVYVKPIKKLFFSKLKSSSPMDKRKPEDEIDVEGGVSKPSTPPYDLTRARHVMDEFQRLANFARPDENEDWEEKIEKTLWSPLQNRIFTKVVRVLTSERLGRLAKANTVMEPIFRRTSLDTAARRFRETLASAGWDWRVAQWLHSLLYENLPQEYLAIYLDILQTLRSKIPQLIEKMIAVQPNLNAKGGSITWENLGPLLKRSWDPVAASLNVNRPKKLPGNPILVIAPTGVGTTVSSRQQKWITQLGALGTVVNVHTHMGLAANRMTMMACVDQLVQATRAKIQDVRGDCPGRPIILIGFNTGAALACQVAQMEHVTAVICLGFPFTTVEGKRGTPDDTLMDIRCPVMFVIGQNATLVRSEDLEDVREKMLVETSLVVVGTADDHLRISTAKKISEGITQSMVDRCILDEIGDFVGSILLQPHPLPLRSTALASFDSKNNKKEPRKRKNSTSSSVESEPNSPSVKKSRPGTPVSSTVAASGSIAASSVPAAPRQGTQLAHVPINAANTNQASPPRKKPRVVSSQKVNLQEQIVSPRLAAQSTSSGSSGLTLNIGSLASLAPLGPIRLAPSTASQTISSTVKSAGAPRTSTAFSKTSKIIPSNMNSQTFSKMRTVMPAGKGFSKMMPSHYKHINITDKGGETKLVNVLTTTGNQVRVSASTAAAMHGKGVGSAGGALSALLQSGRSSLGSAGSPIGRVTSASSILLTPSPSMVNASLASASTTAAKGLENIGSSSGISRPMTVSNRSLDFSKLSMLPSQATAFTSKNYPLSTSAGNVVMLGDGSSRPPRSNSMLLPMSSQNPITILPLPSKMKSQKPARNVPKITVNNSSLQRSQRAKPQPPMKKKPGSNMDEDLGNILDIPIIFAKDGENLSNMEKTSPVPCATNPYDMGVSKLGATTKVVLISNKHEKAQLPAGRMMHPPMQTIVRPTALSTGPAQTINRNVMQSRPQVPPLPTLNRASSTLQATSIRRSNQPTIKYTKIILAKRNSTSGAAQDDKSDQVILTKNTQKPAAKILSYDRNEHRYAAQMPSRSQARFPEAVQEDALEIEDAIKTNIIERRMLTIPEIDLTSPAKDGGPPKKIISSVSSDFNDGELDYGGIIESYDAAD